MDRALLPDAPGADHGQRRESPDFGSPAQRKRLEMSDKDCAASVVRSDVLFAFLDGKITQWSEVERMRILADSDDVIGIDYAHAMSAAFAEVKVFLNAQAHRPAKAGERLT